jgi:hypothetical protein
MVPGYDSDVGFKVGACTVASTVTSDPRGKTTHYLKPMSRTANNLEVSLVKGSEGVEGPHDGQVATEALTQGQGRGVCQEALRAPPYMCALKWLHNCHTTEVWLLKAAQAPRALF